MKRIEITNYERHSVDVDFEDGRILVNLTFTLGDVPKLREIIADLEERR